MLQRGGVSEAKVSPTEPSRDLGVLRGKTLDVELVEREALCSKGRSWDLLPVKVIIDHDNRRLISTVDSGKAATPCSDEPSAAGAGIFDLAENFGSGSDKLELLSTPSKRAGESDGGIRFSFRGFSQNHQLSSEGRLELRLRHRDLTKQRCIRIVSPIGMMRDGLAEDESSPCRYDKSY